MSYFAAVEPDAVVFAVVDNYAAAIGKHAPAHKGAADRAFDVLDFFIALVAILIDIVQMLSVGIENVRDRVFKQGVYFPGIKEQSETVFAARDQKCAVDIERDGLQLLIAMRAQLIRLFLDNRIRMPVFQIDIIM